MDPIVLEVSFVQLRLIRDSKTLLLLSTIQRRLQNQGEDSFRCIASNGTIIEIPTKNLRVLTINPDTLEETIYFV